jgi:uncharacterized protein (UPF0332 family)
LTLPDEDKSVLIAYRIGQAESMIDEVAFLIENKKLIFAVNRIYYGVFYALTAIALKDGYKTSKHSRLMGWFNKNYIATGRCEKKYGNFMYKAFQKRQIGDYEVFSDFSKEEVVQLNRMLQEFIQRIKSILNDKMQ